MTAVRPGTWVLGAVLAALGATYVTAASGAVREQPTQAQAAPQPSTSAITYRVSFPAPEHHWMQVEVQFPDLGAQPLRARMSRSSPGRYAVHEFAKNVSAVEAFDGAGRRLVITRPDADEWDVAGHDGTVRLRYRIFGDWADGTYMGVDTTHAHLNMPAAFIWGVGLEMRPMQIAFAPPAGSNWTAATQLFASPDPLTFTAPNLQYFMDSPTELAELVVSTFTVPNRNGQPTRFKLAVHAETSQADVDALAAQVQRLVREQLTVFGEFPEYEPGEYTFLLDLVPWTNGDGMEHRNSTTISVPGAVLRTGDGRAAVLDAIAHEFFHNWNVERIRPVGLEPFDFTRANITCCLWLAEGFTEYYGELLLQRAGLTESPPLDHVAPVVLSTARSVRTAVEMSEQAPFADAGVANDVHDRNRTFLSYYVYGAAIALGLDLSLRERSDGRLSLDDFMQRLWEEYGAPRDPRQGYVAKPYALTDLRRVLGDISGDRRFANAFFDRFIEGHDVVDYAHLLALAGYVLRPIAPTRGWLGAVPVQEEAGGLRVGGRPGGRVTPVPFDTPLYEAGIDEGDIVVTIDRGPATLAEWTGLTRRAPGDTVRLGVRRRDGKNVTASVRVKADPALQVVPLEFSGGTLTAAQLAFRAAWLGTRVR